MGCCEADAGAGDLDRLLALQADHDQLGEVLRGGVARLGQLDPALLRHVRAVDEVDGLLRVTGEDPTSAAMPRIRVS